MLAVPGPVPILEAPALGIGWFYIQRAIKTGVEPVAARIGIQRRRLCLNMMSTMSTCSWERWLGVGECALVLPDPHDEQRQLSRPHTDTHPSGNSPAQAGRVVRPGVLGSLRPSDCQWLQAWLEKRLKAQRGMCRRFSFLMLFPFRSQDNLLQKYRYRSRVAAASQKH